MASLSGKVAIVTGASSGIGIETAAALASKGAHTILAVRDLAKVEPIIADIKNRTQNNNVEAIKLDLDSFGGVRQFVDNFLARGLPLHILINNAGIMATPYGKTVDGWEQQFATNHLGHFLLTTLLTDKLIENAPSRVVSVSSVANKRGGINWSDLNFESNYDKWIAYAQAKTANVLFAVEYNKRFGSKGVTCNAVHPGGIFTGLQWNVPKEEQLAMGWIDAEGNANPLFKSVSQGAATSVWCAVASELEGNGGHYCEDCGVSGSDRAERFSGCAAWALDPNDASRLWDLSVAAVSGQSSADELIAAEKQKQSQ